MQIPPSAQPNTLKDNTTKTTLSIILATSFFSLLFIFSLSTTSFHAAPSSSARPDPYLFPRSRRIHHSDPSPPSLAFLISGSKGEAPRLLRLLFATYHPRNHYLLHLDRSASHSDREKLALSVQSIAVFRAAKNVDVVGKADFAYSKGSSAISATLHGAAILLRLSRSWDWFVSLRVGDYPLVTQDDLLHIFSYLPKDFNFVSHSSYIGWKESRKLKPIIVDPGLYLSEKADVFHATQKRELPNSFRLFTGYSASARVMPESCLDKTVASELLSHFLDGSSFSILSRSFIEHSILGTDNLPRILLMYFANTPYSLSNYFPTILCNTREFNRTVINYNFQYVPFGQSSGQEPHALNSSEFDSMIRSGAAFATGFSVDEAPDRIDREILGRTPGRVVPGGWCLGTGNSTCSVWGDADILRPGPGAGRLEERIVELLANGQYRSNQCIEE